MSAPEPIRRCFDHAGILGSFAAMKSAVASSSAPAPNVSTVKSGKGVGGCVKSGKGVSTVKSPSVKQKKTAHEQDSPKTVKSEKKTAMKRAFCVV